MDDAEQSRFKKLLRQLEEEHDASLTLLRQRFLNLRQTANSDEQDVIPGMIQPFAAQTHSGAFLNKKPQQIISGLANKQDVDIDQMSEISLGNDCLCDPSSIADMNMPGVTVVASERTSSAPSNTVESEEMKRMAHGRRSFKIIGSKLADLDNEVLDKRQLKRLRRTSKSDNDSLPSSWRSGTRKDLENNNAVLEWWMGCQEKIIEFMERWEDMDEPTKFDSVPGRVVNHFLFQGFAFCMILFDTLFTAMTLNHAMKTGSEDLTQTMQIISWCILTFYTTELLLKLVAYGKYFFIGRDLRWNLLDLLLVLQALFNFVLDLIFSVQGENVTFIRFLRMMKIAKIFRLVRALKFLRELRVMVVSIAGSLGVLFWAFVTLGLVLYVFSLLFVQAMSSYLMDNRDTIDEETLLRIDLHFGSVQATTLTLYQSASSGIDWIAIYDLVQLSGPVYSTAFIFFIGFFNIAVLNILTGIFMDKAVNAAAPDRDVAALEQRRKDERYAEELSELLVSMDEDRSGTINWDEFMTMSGNRYVQSYFLTLGLDIKDAKMFFGLLTRLSGKDEVPIEEFIWRCVRMKGAANSIDLQAVAYEVTRIHDRLRSVCEAFGMTNDFNHQSSVKSSNAPSL